MKNIHMFGISPKNGVKKHFFRPEKWHGFARRFYSALHTMCHAIHPFATVLCPIFDTHIARSRYDYLWQPNGTRPRTDPDYAVVSGRSWHFDGDTTSQWMILCQQ